MDGLIQTAKGEWRDADFHIHGRPISQILTELNTINVRLEQLVTYLQNMIDGRPTDSQERLCSRREFAIHCLIERENELQADLDRVEIGRSVPGTLTLEEQRAFQYLRRKRTRLLHRFEQLRESLEQA